jgi:putative MATE family efflux protein
MLVFGYSFGGAFINALTADEETATQGRAFLYAYLPSLALMFPGNAMMSALRGVGVVGPTMWLQTGSVLLNAVLAPILVVGWGTGAPLGAAGAGLASTIANVASFIALIYLFPRVQPYLRLHWDALAPKLAAWRRILFVGLPTSLEFLMMFVIIAVTYWSIRDFGADAQAGLGIGGRIMQSIFLPAMAIAFAAGPVAGQNFGARKFDRVRETFRATALFGSSIMLTLTILCHLSPELMVRPFTDDPEVVGVAAGYLQIASWNFVANGLIMAASSMFQGMGDTRPALLSSATRLFTFALPAIWLSFRPETTLEQFWWLGVLSILLQCAISMTLLFHTFGRKLMQTPA